MKKGEMCNEPRKKGVRKYSGPDSEKIKWRARPDTSKKVILFDIFRFFTCQQFHFNYKKSYFIRYLSLFYLSTIPFQLYRPYPGLRTINGGHDRIPPKK